MKVDNNLIEKWESIKSYGDVKAICAESGISRMRIYSAFKTGEMADDVFDAISSFYSERQKKIVKAHNQIR